MRPLAFAAIRTGLIDDATIAQFKRWGAIPRDLDTSIVEDPEDALELIQRAMDAEEQVRLQSTDLDLLKYYLDKDNQDRGQLVVVDHRTGTKATKAVVFAKRLHGAHPQYVIPWVSDSIVEVLTNGQTYLRYSEGGKSVKVYFTEIEELYFGNVKAFMVCAGLVEATDVLR